MCTLYVIMYVCVGLGPKGNYKVTKPGVKTPERFAKSKLLIYLYILLLCGYKVVVNYLPH